MKVTVIFLISLTFYFSEQSDKIRYDNFQVYRITPKTPKHLQLLKKLENDYDFSFWKSVKSINTDVDIMSPSKSINKLQEIIVNNNLESKMIIDNVQRLIDNERGVRKSDAEFDWDDYHTLEEINVWLSRLAETYPDIVKLEKGGASYEGRPIVGVHLSFASNNTNKITSAVVTYILNQLLTSTDPSVREVAESHDWYIFPVVNPDGFSYTHSTDRLWRKTRVPYSNISDGCYGADPNRNWDYHYGEGGGSDEPCSETYQGPEAFSEPLAQSLSEYVSTIGNTLEGYISFHSYSQILLLPYGYTPDHLDNYDELYQVGLKAIDFSQRYGTEYDIGDVAEVLYVASGGSPDWVKGKFGTRITYTYELRDTGDHGFILPAEQIIPTAEETLDSLVTIFQEFAKIL